MKKVNCVRFRCLRLTPRLPAWALLLALAACPALSTSATTTNLVNGLLSYWSFDGNLNDSVNEFHGTARGSDPIQFVDSQTGFGQALKLTGSNYVEITGGPVNGLDSPNGSLSIAGWFKVDTFDKDWQALIAKGESSNWRVARRAAENTIAYAGGTGEGANDTPNINDGAWHHFAAITDANTTEFGTALYIDGTRYSVNTNTPALTASAMNVFIGENPGALNRMWKGEVDDLGIWNRVLSAAEVSALFNGGAGATISALTGISAPTNVTVMDFQFNEGRGTNTVDSVHELTGVLGIGLGNDTNNVPVITTNSPSGAAGDRAVSLNGRGAGLVVNDVYSNSTGAAAPTQILAFATNAPFTIETWINIATNSTLQFQGLGAYGRSYKLGLNNNELQFTLYGIVDINSGIFPTNGWHHVAAAWTPGTGVEFFLDGTSVTNIAETRVPRAYQNNYLTIGAENVGTTNLANTFQGMIDRFRIHSEALTADQLDSVANTPQPALANTVVGYSFNETNWPFASSGTVARPAVPSPSPVWTSDTPTGRTNDFALRFLPGTQVIVRDTNTVVRLDTNNPAFTLQAWVKYSGSPSTRQVFYYNNGPGGALSMSITTSNTLQVTTLGVADVPSSAFVPGDNQWHHVAVVHEPAMELRYYVDGALGDTVPYTSQSVNFSRTNQVFYIGSEPTFGLQYVGLLDRLKLTSGILSPAELDYPAGGAPPSVVTVGALDGGVGVVFDRAVSLATVTNLANYTVSGTTVTNVTVVSGNYVILGVAATPTNAFSVTVQGVGTSVGDVMAAPATVEALAEGGATITSGLTAYWSFDGHLLDSIDGFHGAARGSVPLAFTNGVTGFGRALQLSGTNYVEIPGSSNALQFANGSLSIAGWFKVDTFDKDWQALIAKGENQSWRVARRGSENTIAYAGGTGEGPDDTPDINDGNWHHFVAVTDATASEFGTALYIDGVIYSINTNAPALETGTSNVFIGENPQALNRMWKGAIDDVGLWNRVLASQEIAFLYNEGSGMPVSALPGVTSPVPPLRPYSIGLNFGANHLTNLSTLNPIDAAGVPGVAQANWNNLSGANGTNVNNIVADTDFETATNTTVTVSWTSNGTWASTGVGEENNGFTGPDRVLMAGYLDTGNATTTSVTISNVPPELTTQGYDVYIYAMGGVGGRGGGYRVLEAGTTNVLSPYVRVQSPTNSMTFIPAPVSTTSTNYAVGNYFVFTGLTAPAITIEATTAGGLGFSGTPRAPVNAVQLVASEEGPGASLSIERTADGIVITFEGTLESTGDLGTPDWQPVAGDSPITVQPTESARFYRARQ